MPAAARILVVEDEAPLREILRFRLEKAGHSVRCAAGSSEALDEAGNREFDVLLLDVNLGNGRTGIDLLREFRGAGLLAQAILVTAQDSITIAGEAMRLGAIDYIRKPIDFDALGSAIGRALDRSQASRQELAIRRLVEKSSRFPEIVSESPAMLGVLSVVQKAAPGTTPVLILGETGTGKELIARTIHLLSPRSASPFVPLNCAGVPETLIESELFGHEKGAFTGAEQLNRGLFEIADQGTIFLDELEEMSLGMQAKLLRVLDGGEFRRVGGRATLATGARVVAATNRPPSELVSKGRMREDLYFRLGVVTVRLPSLRERTGDIGLLARYFLRMLSRETGRKRTISDEAIRALERYGWPGNVRELRNLMERLLLVTDQEEIGVTDLPQEILFPDQESSGMVAMTLEAVEKNHILRVLNLASHNRREAARILGISEMTLYRRLRQYGVGD